MVMPVTPLATPKPSNPPPSSSLSSPPTSSPPNPILRPASFPLPPATYAPPVQPPEQVRNGTTYYKNPYTEFGTTFYAQPTGADYQEYYDENAEEGDGDATYDVEGEDYNFDEANGDEAGEYPVMNDGSNYYTNYNPYTADYGYNTAYPSYPASYPPPYIPGNKTA